MKIKHYLYNAFLVEEGAIKIAIDPGCELRLGAFLKPIIPKEEWATVTHVLVTHADPDHYWHADRVVLAGNAALVCGKELVEQHNGKSYIVSPRVKKATYKIELARVYPLDPGKELSVDQVKIKGIRTVHGNLTLKLFFGLIRKTWKKKPGELFALGNIGFQISLNNKTILNLGDTVLLPEWGESRPDILMIPIGGRNPKNTMDAEEAVEAVKIIKPKLVIPCHYNLPFFWKKDASYADDLWFKQEVEKQGISCVIMRYGEEIEY